MERDLADAIGPQLHADRVLGRTAQQRRRPAVRGAAAGHPAPIDLLLLIAVHRIVEVEREVRHEVERVAHGVGRHLRERPRSAALPLEGDAVTAGLAAVGRVDGAEAIDQPVVDGALRRRLGGVPGAVIPRIREGQAVDAVAAAVAQHGVGLVVGVGHGPRSVVARQLHRRQQRAAPDLRRERQQAAAEAVGAALEGEERTLQRRRIGDRRRAGGGEVALVREVRPLRELDAGDDLRNQEVDVGVALAVRVGRHVHRRAGHRHREVAAVIEVEAAQEVLVGLALAAVLRDDDARHGLEHLALAHDRPHVELTRGDRALARRLRDADQALRGIVDVGQVGEAAAGHDGHVGAHRQLEHRVAPDLAAVDHDTAVDGRPEVHQRDHDRVRAARHVLEDVAAVGVGDGHPRPAARGGQLDRGAGQRRAGVVRDPARHPCLALRRRRARCARQHERDRHGEADRREAEARERGEGRRTTWVELRSV